MIDQPYAIDTTPQHYTNTPPHYVGYAVDININTINATPYNYLGQVMHFDIKTEPDAEWLSAKDVIAKFQAEEIKSQTLSLEWNLTSDEIKYTYTSGSDFFIDNEFAILSQQLPGIDLIVEHPGPCTLEQQSQYNSGDRSRSLYLMIQHLNDFHKWTRDEIADWVETFDEVPVFK